MSNLYSSPALLERNNAMLIHSKYWTASSRFLAFNSTKQFRCSCNIFIFIANIVDLSNTFWYFCVSTHKTCLHILCKQWYVHSSWFSVHGSEQDIKNANVMYIYASEAGGTLYDDMLIPLIRGVQMVMLKYTNPSQKTWRCLSCSWL